MSSRRSAGGSSPLAPSTASATRPDMQSKAGRLVVISGPSGAGKSTLLKRLYEECPHLVPSVSATTRPPRPGERDGIDYYFLSADDFASRKAAGEFLECFEVFGHGFWYGTLESEVTPSLKAGKWVVLEIDVQGAQAITERYPDAITIFVRPSSVDELQRRLRRRATESDELIERRLEVARRELECASRYQHQVLNDDADSAVAEICKILQPQGV